MIIDLTIVQSGFVTLEKSIHASTIWIPRVVVERMAVSYNTTKFGSKTETKDFLI